MKTVVDAFMQRTWHIPLYARRVVQENGTVNWLCEVTDDQKTYTFTLRQGVKFHNGETVTADDVVYSIQRCA